MVDMALNGSGIHDTARVLRVSPTTVINTLKKKSQAYSKSMKDFSSVLMLSRCRSSSTRWRQPRWMKCGTDGIKVAISTFRTPPIHETPSTVAA